MSELYGTLASRVRIVFVDFHTEMWRFGGMSNAVMHNEVTSGQHEILPIFALMTCLGKLERPDARAPSIFLETLPSIFLALRLVRFIHWTRRITWTCVDIDYCSRDLCGKENSCCDYDHTKVVDAFRVVCTETGSFSGERSLSFLSLFGVCLDNHGFSCPITLGLPKQGVLLPDVLEYS